MDGIKMKEGHYIINTGNHEARVELIDFLLDEGFKLDSWESIDEAYRVTFPIVIDVEKKSFQYLTSTVHAAAASIAGFTKVEKFYNEYSKHEGNKAH